MTQLRKAEPPTVDQDDPWANDALEREAVAEYLTPVIASIKQPFVIGLHSPFGTGKSYFIQCWRAHFRSEGFLSVYFNAWETDFSQDALSAFMAALRKQLSELDDKKMAAAAQKGFEKLAKESGPFFREKLAPIVFRGIVRKALGTDTAEEIFDLSELDNKDVENVLGSVADEMLKTQETAQDTLTSFRSYLEKTIESIVKTAKEDEKKKIIVFVDELDRCRPTYAVEVLECIKHFFAVHGLVFVLAIDDTQLRSAIAAVYGSDFDADGYLRRFIDWPFILPPPSGAAFASFLCQRFDLQESGKFNNSNDFYDLGALINGFGVFANAYELTLRQQEQIFTQVNLAIRSLGEKQAPFANLLGVLAVLRLVHPEQYHACCKGDSDPDEFIKILRSKLENIPLKGFYGDWESFQPIFHSWFLNQTTTNDLYNRISAYKEEYKNAVDNEKKILETNYKYLEQVLECYRYANSIFHFSSRSAAKFGACSP